MPKHFYTLRNVASLAVHYGLTGAVAVGSVMLGQPWVAGIVLALEGTGHIIGAVQGRKSADMIQDVLASHENSLHSPRLKEMVNQLYAKTGYTAETCPVYDFRLDENKAKDKDRKIVDKIGDMLKSMGRTHNAAAIVVGKPSVMVSEPLLKLLDDKEEYAVLAHEFAHLKSRHGLVQMPLKALTGFANTLNFVTNVVTAFAAGAGAVITSIASNLATSIAVQRMHKDFNVVRVSDGSLTIPDLYKKKQVQALGAVSGKIAGVSVLGYLNPAYLAVYAAVKAMGIATTVLSATMSRSAEYQADRGAVVLGADPLALITGLRKVAAVNENSVAAVMESRLPKKTFLTKQWQKATSTHPTLENRVKRLAKLAQKQGADQETIRQATQAPVRVDSSNNLEPDVIKEMMRRL